MIFHETRPGQWTRRQHLCSVALERSYCLVEDSLVCFSSVVSRVAPSFAFNWLFCFCNAETKITSPFNPGLIDLLLPSSPGLFRNITLNLNEKHWGIYSICFQGRQWQNLPKPTCLRRCVLGKKDLNFIIEKTKKNLVALAEWTSKGSPLLPLL